MIRASLTDSVAPAEGEETQQRQAEPTPAQSKKRRVPSSNPEKMFGAPRGQIRGRVRYGIPSLLVRRQELTLLQADLLGVAAAASVPTRNGSKVLPKEREVIR